MHDVQMHVSASNLVASTVDRASIVLPVHVPGTKKEDRRAPARQYTFLESLKLVCIISYDTTLSRDGITEHHIIVANKTKKADNRRHLLDKSSMEQSASKLTNDKRQEGVDKSPTNRKEQKAAKNATTNKQQHQDASKSATNGKQQKPGGGKTNDKRQEGVDKSPTNRKEQKAAKNATTNKQHQDASKGSTNGKQQKPGGGKTNDKRQEGVDKSPTNRKEQKAAKNATTNKQQHQDASKSATNGKQQKPVGGKKKNKLPVAVASTSSQEKKALMVKMLKDMERPPPIGGPKKSCVIELIDVADVMISSNSALASTISCTNNRKTQSTSVPNDLLEAIRFVLRAEFTATNRAAEDYFNDFSDRNFVLGMAFEAIVACHVAHSVLPVSCVHCGSQRSIQWCGGKRSSWADITCLTCQASYEIKSKESQEAISMEFERNSCQGGSYSGYEARVGSNYNRRCFVAFVSRTSKPAYVGETICNTWLVEVAELGGTQPQMQVQPSLNHTGAGPTSKFQVRPGTRKIWFRIPAIEFDLETIAREIFDCRFPGKWEGLKSCTTTQRQKAAVTYQNVKKVSTGRHAKFQLTHFGVDTSYSKQEKLSHNIFPQNMTATTVGNQELKFSEKKATSNYENKIRALKADLGRRKIKGVADDWEECFWEDQYWRKGIRK
jgi:hypothetical protein